MTHIIAFYGTETIFKWKHETSLYFYFTIKKLFDLWIILVLEILYCLVEILTTENIIKFAI